MRVGPVAAGRPPLCAPRLHPAHVPHPGERREQAPGSEGRGPASRWGCAGAAPSGEPRGDTPRGSIRWGPMGVRGEPEFLSRPRNKGSAGGLASPAAHTPRRSGRHCLRGSACPLPGGDRVDASLRTRMQTASCVHRSWERPSAQPGDRRSAVSQVKGLCGRYAPALGRCGSAASWKRAEELKAATPTPAPGTFSGRGQALAPRARGPPAGGPGHRCSGSLDFSQTAQGSGLVAKPFASIALGTASRALRPDPVV